METYNVVRLTHACSSMIGVLILAYIWYCYYYRQQQKKSLSDMDLGLPLLSAAYLFWAVLRVYQYTSCGQSCVGSEAKVVRTLSGINNALFLASFSYFKHGFQMISKLGNRNRWLLIVLSLTGPICISYLFASEETAKIIDLIFSSSTLLFMGVLLVLAFHNRGLSGLSVLALLVVSLEIISQISSITGGLCVGDWSAVIDLVAHSLLLANFIALAFTWIIEDEGLLEKFDLHKKSRILLEDLTRERKENIRAFLDFQLQLISEHSDLKSVCQNMLLYYHKINIEDNLTEIRQLQFIISENTKLFNTGMINAGNRMESFNRVSAALIERINNEIAIRQQA